MINMAKQTKEMSVTKERMLKKWDLIRNMSLYRSVIPEVIPFGMVSMWEKF